jgi:uncharacterized protein
VLHLRGTRKQLSLIMPTSFTPLHSFLGGVLIGLSASGILFLLGRMAGISGILGGLLSSKKGDRLWRAGFLGGLFVSGFLVQVFFPEAVPTHLITPYGVLVIAGLLVGFGTRLGSGCTSGHGVCGISRLSPRSIVATLTFMIVGFLTVYFARHVL